MGANENYHLLHAYLRLYYYYLIVIRIYELPTKYTYKIKLKKKTQNESNELLFIQNYLNSQRKYLSNQIRSTITIHRMASNETSIIIS